MKSTNMQLLKAKPNRGQPPRWRPSFTLVELLIAISIIGIMTGMIMFALLGAQNDARVARTRGTIQKLSDIVLQQWEEYRYKPVDVRINLSSTQVMHPRERARVRMMILRDNMRMEMPDRITDLLYHPSQYTVVYQEGGNQQVGRLDRALPPRFGLLYESLRSTISSLRAQGHPQWATLTLVDLNTLPPVYAGGSAVGRYSSQNDGQWYNAVQNSELLYLLISSSQYAGSSALEFFRPSEVADTDGDGLLEFVDAWGAPISWIRWPAGYPGDLVRYADDDAMDPLKTDWRYRAGVAPEWHPKTLVPLILSAGLDGEFGVTFDFYDNLASPAVPPIVYATMEWPLNPNPPFGTNGPHHAVGTYHYVDPFFTNGGVAPSGFNQIGSIPTLAVELATDNITNHDILLEP